MPPILRRGAPELASPSPASCKPAAQDLKNDDLKLVGTGTPLEEFTRIVGIDRWRGIESKFGP